MNPPVNSQIAPLPLNLPFRLVSKTIGCGAYASIRKAVPLESSSPIVAIKFINKDHAFRIGRLTTKQIKLEISLHNSTCGVSSKHENIIQLYHHGEDSSWLWIMMELAEGGDLFDKIEADEGVPEDVAHFYFKQLISAISWCHSKGIAHRDVKPENMLLSSEGCLKLADFGLAVNYLHISTGQSKLSSTVCGSPPYIAPEIVQAGINNQARKKDPNIKNIGYQPDKTDLWSCGIVLFVLLVGNTPWDTPIADGSAEFAEFLITDGRPNDELWDNIPTQVLSLIRGMLKINVDERFNLREIMTHPWFTSSNKFMNKKGQAIDSVFLATTMMERLHIDMDDCKIKRSETITQKDYESQEWNKAFPNTQPETPISDDSCFDWESTTDRILNYSASQPITNNDTSLAIAFTDAAQHLMENDISMSQYTNSQKLPLTLTQAARKFGDIAPSHALTRFYSVVPLQQLIDSCFTALLQLGLRGTIRRQENINSERSIVNIWIKGLDGRRQLIYGDVIIETLGMNLGGLKEVRFVKAKGDPVEWRRLFKKVVGLVKDVVFIPGQS